MKSRLKLPHKILALYLSHSKNWVHHFTETYQLQQKEFLGSLVRPVGPPEHCLHNHLGKLSWVCPSVFFQECWPCFLGFLFLRCHLYLKQQILHSKQRTSVPDLETPRSAAARWMTIVKTGILNIAGQKSVKRWQHNFQGSLVIQVTTQAPPWAYAPHISV